MAASCTVAPIASSVCDAGSTVTLVATGSDVSITVMPTMAEMSPAVAVTLAMPLPTAVTSPSPSTVTTASSLLVHVTSGSAMGTSFASLTETVNCRVCPISVRVVASASTSMLMAAGTWATMISALPMASPAWAVISAMPLSTAVTRPSWSTVATASSPLDQVTATSVITFSCWSSTTAASWTVVPIASSVCDAGSTVTVVGTGFATVMAALEDRLPVLAVISVMPLPTAVTSPSPSTVTTASSLLVQVMVWPDMMLFR